MVLVLCCCFAYLSIGWYPFCCEPCLRGDTVQPSYCANDTQWALALRPKYPLCDDSSSSLMRRAIWLFTFSFFSFRERGGKDKQCVVVFHSSVKYIFTYVCRRRTFRAYESSPAWRASHAHRGILILWLCSSGASKIKKKKKTRGRRRSAFAFDRMQKHGSQMLIWCVARFANNLAPRAVYLVC